MTAWILSFGWNWALVPVVAWFIHGVWKALYRPRVKLLDYVQVPGTKSRNSYGDEVWEYLVTLNRQQLLPPWRNLQETWLVRARDCVREGDGRCESDFLAATIRGALSVAIARAKETEELVK